MSRPLFFPAAFLVLLQALPAQAVEPGEYSGAAKYGGDLTLSVTGKGARIEVTTDGCQGDTEGRLRAVGDGHWQMRPDWPGCVIDFRRKGNRITVREGSECFQLHGAACSFDGSLGAKTGAASGGASGEQAASAAASGAWVYGEDPVLGLSAHIRTPEGAIGIACIADGSNPAAAEILAVRVTPDLAGPNGKLYMFDGKDGGRSIASSAGAGYAELRDNTCGISLDSFRSADAMYLIDGTIAAVSSTGSVAEITIDHGGRQTVVSGGSDAADKIGAKTIPLKGSATAIKALLRACPAARMDIESDCGL